VEQLRRNNTNYERLIAEKKSKMTALEKQTFIIRNGPGFKVSLDEPAQIKSEEA
jgi:hypothetical protein